MAGGWLLVIGSALCSPLGNTERAVRFTARASLLITALVYAACVAEEFGKVVLP
jgi:hypothetical protein